MKSMREELTNMGERLCGKIVGEIGSAAVKLGDQARGHCLLMFAYEPEIPMELLQESIEE